MPIEVRELVIKATVAEEGAHSSAASKGNNSITPDEEVIRICVERVLEIIKDKTER